MNETETHKAPRARIREALVPVPADASWDGESWVVPVVAGFEVYDENKVWGTFVSYSAARARLVKRQTVERAMRTRAANRARRA